MFAFVSAPVDTLALSPSPSSLGSLYGNSIGDEGASALAAVLKETKITNLKCAAAQAFAFVSAPIDTLSTRLRSHARSLQSNCLGPEGGTALAEGLKGNSTLQSLE